MGQAREACEAGGSLVVGGNAVCKARRGSTRSGEMGGAMGRGRIIPSKGGAEEGKQVPGPQGREAGGLGGQPRSL